MVLSRERWIELFVLVAGIALGNLLTEYVLHRHWITSYIGDEG